MADVMLSSGTTAKCSVPFSSYETISDLFLVEKLTKSRCGTSNKRPEAVSILNGLFFVISSSIDDASIRSKCFRFIIGIHVATVKTGRTRTHEEIF